jgi:hypothetical protein
MKRDTREKIMEIIGKKIEKEANYIIRCDKISGDTDFKELYMLYNILASMKLEEQSEMSKQATEVMTHAMENVDLSKFNFSDALKGFIK